MKNKVKYAGAVYFVFLFTLIIAWNLSYLRYGVPEHYGGSWLNVAISAVMLIVVIALGMPDETT